LEKWLELADQDLRKLIRVLALSHGISERDMLRLLLLLGIKNWSNGGILIYRSTITASTIINGKA